MNNKKLHKRIEEIPGEDGWYKGDTHDVFCTVADELVNFGVPDDAIFDVLETVFWAASGEYGV